MRRAWLLPLSVLLPLAAQSPPSNPGPPPPTGSFSGTLLDDSGNPISATLHATRWQAPVVTASAHSNQDGTFSFALMPIGTYVVCVQTKGTIYLDPCSWAPV